MDRFSDAMECSPLPKRTINSRRHINQPMLFSPIRPKKRMKISHKFYLSPLKKDNDEYPDDFKDMEYFGSTASDRTVVKTTPLIPGQLQFISPFRDEDSNTTISSTCSESISSVSQESLPSFDSWSTCSFGTPTARYLSSTNYVDTSCPKPVGDVDFSSFNEDLKKKKLAGELLFDSPDYIPPPRPNTVKFLVPPKIRLTQSAEFTPSQRKRKRDLLLSPEIDDEDDLDFMEPNELMRIMDLGDDSFGRVFIVDTRYPYEYEGGHILNAMHLPCRDQIELLFERIRTIRCTVIFHCEKSLIRGPRAARYFNDLLDHEGLTHLKVFVLEGGYSKFYRTQSSEQYITPKGFVRELEKSFTLRKRAYRDKVNKTWKGKRDFKSKKTSRSFCN